jgi:hypothetical protein
MPMLFWYVMPYMLWDAWCASHGDMQAGSE